MMQWMLLYLCGSTEPCRMTVVYVLKCAHEVKFFHEALVLERVLTTGMM
jgi:hypothetical protein